MTWEEKGARFPVSEAGSSPRGLLSFLLAPNQLLDATLKETNTEKIEDAHKDTAAECRVVAREEVETHTDSGGQGHVRERLWGGSRTGSLSVSFSPMQVCVCSCLPMLL